MSSLQVAYRTNGAQAFNILAPRSVDSQKLLLSGQTTIDGEWILVSASNASHSVTNSQFESSGSKSVLRFSVLGVAAMAVLGSQALAP